MKNIVTHLLGSVCFVAVCVLSIPAAAASNVPDVRIVDLEQNKKGGMQLFNADIPSDVVDAIKNAQVISLIPINAEERFSEQVIKADEIIFGPNSRMILEGLNHPWVRL